MSGASQFPELVTKSRREIEAYSASEGSVCISITTPGDTVARLIGPWADVLRLEFGDDRFDDWRTRQVTISPRDALRVVEFVAAHRQAPRLVIHCTVGASRSVSMAMALAYCFTWRRWTPVWWDHLGHDAFIPNRSVFTRICEAYEVMQRGAPC